LTIFVGIVVKNFLGFVWWVLIGLPLATIRTSVTLVLASAVVGMLYLYALNSHHGGMLQGNDAFFYASQYHANTAPGIL
jgi:F0F1-type ATP synthase membrane subunit a